MNKKEKAKKLLEKLQEKEAEVKNLKKSFSEIEKEIFGDMQRELSSEFPEVHILQNSDGLLTKVLWEGRTFDLWIGKGEKRRGKYKLLCLFQLTIEELQKEPVKYITDSEASKWKDLFQKHILASIWSEFGSTDYDGVLSCYKKVLNKILNNK